jgi:hypothetical protein
LKVVSGFTEAFQRTQFHPIAWKDGFQDLTGYLLTDTAPAGDAKGDLNVLCYIGIDEKHKMYILDLQVGYWKMYEFVERYLAMLQKWQPKVNHRLELWEKGQSYLTYFQHIQMQAKAKNIRVASYADARNQGAIGKDTRIASLQARFQMHEVYVCNTVPKHWQAPNEVRLLWDPEGETDIKTGAKVPGGDLVEQFVRFPHHKKKDIPDTVALVDSIDKATQQRVCFYAQPRRRKSAEPTHRVSVQTPQRFHGSTSRFYSRIHQRRVDQRR